ncbi:maleylpyruvate isomerase family mycothiol-dependent enzyme [Nocardioides aurantiacus]|uniref:Uncharacterized protein (TIGR03086 family) n=1 Tax=Nocardioides aurantiacus TaxID=86796 RepID=A0A3N2CZ41_9ACTN|nr:maleylpyruvate isomerase family mycothiol-dependent enzyme [Nocardioides aurantiacus]ROR92756.1 uncharacterized protein (TIGR03086 family) [Nocardioides aurantiacus]
MPTLSAPRALAVLDAAVVWTHDCLQAARTADAGLPTPCAGWDLGDLLVHMEDSLAALAEAALGRVALDAPLPAAAREPAVLVERVVRRACHTRARWQALPTGGAVEVDVLALDRDTLALVGALEVTVHGWDVAAAVGPARRPPEDLAARLLPVARHAVPAGERGGRFAPALVPTDGSAAARLLAHLGRDAGWRVGRPR